VLRVRIGCIRALLGLIFIFMFINPTTRSLPPLLPMIGEASYTATSEGSEGPSLHVLQLLVVLEKLSLLLLLEKAGLPQFTESENVRTRGLLQILCIAPLPLLLMSSSASKYVEGGRLGELMVQGVEEFGWRRREGEREVDDDEHAIEVEVDDRVNGSNSDRDLEKFDTGVKLLCV